MKLKFLSKLVIVLVIVSLFFFLSCEKKNPPKEKTTSDIVVVDSVLDGDTFILSNGEVVRIGMIDTPEEGEPFYEESTAFLESLTLGKKVTLKPVGSGKDRYGRTLAEVLADSVNVSKVLLINGLATIYIFSDNKYLINDYLSYQIEAMDNKAGIWSLPEPLAEKYYVAVKGSYRFHRPFCFSLKRSDPEKLYKIKTRREALLQAVSPCRNCRP